MVIKAATAAQLKRKWHTVAQPVNNEHKMIDVTDTSDSRVHKGKKGKVRVHSEHYVCLTDNPVLCTHTGGA